MTSEGQSSSVSSSNMDIPLALRKSRRATAGIKKEPVVTYEKMEAALYASRNKDDVNKAGKRKLSSPTPSSSSKDDKDTPPSQKKRKNPIPKAIRDMDSRNDFYCWVCHREGSVICCEVCPRVYHVRCAKLEDEPEGDWFCPECEKITNAECVDTQSPALAMLTTDQFCRLLMYALQRMKHSGSEPFQKPVQPEFHPNYRDYVFYPMDLSTLEKNITRKVYGSTEAFLADSKWLLHNCVLYNGANHKLTTSARMVVKICEHEMSEIEICPDCYLSSCIRRDNYFCEPCRDPHKLVWAKLKGFPFWPAKALRQVDGQVDVRFFGQHDRAWVSSSSCYMMSEEIPFPIKKRKGAFENAMQEMELHIENIRRRHGSWEYAAFRTPYDPRNTYTHNHMKFTSQSPAQAMNGVKTESKDPDSTKKVAKIKIKIKKTSGMPAELTLEGVDPQDYPETPQRDNTGISTHRKSPSNKAKKHSPNKPRNIFEAMKIEGGEEKSPSKPLHVPAKNVTEGPLKLKIGGGVVTATSTTEPTVNQASAEQEKPLPTGVFVISGDAKDNQPSTTEGASQSTATPTTGGGASHETLQIDTAITYETDKLTSRKSQDEKEVKGESENKACSEKTIMKVSDDKLSIKFKTPDKTETSKEKECSTPSILPTKLPSLSDLEEATSQLSSKHTMPNTETSNLSTPTDKFKLHLNKTIESCKAQLGITETDALEEMETEKDAESDSDAASLSNGDDEDSSDADEADKDVEAMEVEKDEEKSQDKKMDDSNNGDVVNMNVDDAKVDVVNMNVDDTKVDDSSDIVDAKTDTEKIPESDGIKCDNEQVLKVDSKAECKTHTEVQKPSSKDAIPVTPDKKKEDTPKPLEDTPQPLEDTPQPLEDSPQPLEDTPQPLESLDIDVIGNNKDKPLSVKTLSTNSEPLTSKVNDSTQKSLLPAPQNIDEETNESRKTPVKNSTVLNTNQICSPATNSSPVCKSPVSPSLQPVKFSARLAEKAAQRAAAAVAMPSSQSTPVGDSFSGFVSTPHLNTRVTPAMGEPQTRSNLQMSNTDKLSMDFKKYSNKIMQYVDTSLKEFYQEMTHNVSKVNVTASEDLTSTAIKKLKVDLEVMQWKHQQELAELRHNAELTVAEIRQSLQKEKTNSIADVKKECLAEKEAAVMETKKKQWCANCGKEAIFFCCWNTSYCDYPCQQSHWPEHMNTCAQGSTSAGAMPQDSTDHRDGGSFDNQVRTAVSIQQAPTEGRKANGTKSVVVSQPVRVQYVQQPVPQSTTATPAQVVVQTQVAPTVQSYGPLLAPMNTLTRAPTTIVQQRPIIQQGSYPVLRPQGGVVTQTVTQAVPTQIVVRPQMATVAPTAMQIRNIVSYPRSRPV